MFSLRLTQTESLSMYEIKIYFPCFLCFLIFFHQVNPLKTTDSDYKTLNFSETLQLHKGQKV